MTTRTLIAELKTCQKEFFESKLALYLIKNPELFPAVKKTSAYICDFITQNSARVLEQIRICPAICEELCNEQYFGRINLSKERATPILLLNAILQVLREQTNLSQVMQIHAIFAYRIYEKITIIKTSDREEFKTTMKELLAPENRGRIERKTTSDLTSRLGITHNPVFTKQLRETGEFHTRAIDRFSADPASPSHAAMTAENIPFVAGASGHTSTLLRGIKLYNHLTPIEYTEYALACFAFLTAGGNHSFHEVMIIAKKFGVLYEINNYKNLLTEAMHSQAEIQELFKLLQEPLSPRSITTAERLEQSLLSKTVYKNILSSISFIKRLKPQLDDFLQGEKKPARLVLGYV